MTHRTKRTSAPAPREIPSVSAQPVPAPGAHPVPPPAIPGAWGPPHPPQSMVPSAPAPQEIPSATAQPVPAPPPAIPGAWCPPHPPQSMAPSTPYWFAGLQHPTMAGSSSQCPWWAPAGSNGPSTNHEDFNLQAWALKSYEVDHKVDGPFMFKHCWDVLRKEPKWDAYLERLEEIEPENRKFNVGEDVGQHFSLDNARDDRPIGGKQAKEQQKRKRKDQACVIDLEDELHKFVDAQNKASEGRKEMLETQRLVSSEALEAKKLAYLAAKEHKESTMLEAYRSMMMQDTTVMAEDVRAEHVLALRCFREKLFGKTD
nr:unnamed protein product [Digitaria exilis]